MGWLDVDLGHLNKDGRHGELWGYLLMQMGWALNSKPSPKPSWAILKAAISSWASPSKGAFHHWRHDEEGSCGSAMKRGAVAVVWWRPEGVADSESAKNDDATRVWKVVKPSRPPTNAFLMKTRETMTDMRRKMAEAACMFGPHACRRAALDILLLAIGFSRLSHLTILSSFL